jgi:dihydroorotate dehydrogenase
MLADTGRRLEPIYNYDESFEENYRTSLAFDEEPLPDGLLSGEDWPWELLGRRIGYPIGVPASPLTANADKVSKLARQGFNVITYKTVRSVERPAFLPPNWFFVKGHRRPLPVEEAAAGEIEVEISGTTPPNDRPFSMVNSFGMPSMSPDEWMRDVQDLAETLRDDQLLIVSVVGTDDDEEDTEGDLLDDFVRVARMAEEAGAKAIELNLSCPNTLADGGEGMGDPTCEDPDVTGRIVRAVRAGLRAETKLVAKLGYLGPARLGDVIEEIGDQVDAIAGINTLQVTVVDADGQPAFRGTAKDPGRTRPKAGLSGIAIRDLALGFVRALAQLRRANSDWSFDIVGMGGVMATHDVRALMANGADAVQATCVVANDAKFARSLLQERKLLQTALKDERWKFRSAEGLAEELNVGVEIARDLLETSPDVARKSVMTDRYGRELYTARDRPATTREKIERFRAVL